MSVYLRMTPATLSVLQELISSYESDEYVWGLMLSSLTGYAPGTVYPILDRLTRELFVTSMWEDDTQRRGPRRRLYKLTPQGYKWSVTKVERSGQ